MAETFCLRIGETERPNIEDFFSAFQSFVGLLKDLDAAIAENKHGNLRWLVTSLRKDPIPVVGVSSSLKRPGEDIASRIEREMFGGISALNQKAEIGKNFPDAALAKLEKIAKTTPRIGTSAVYIDSREPIKPTADITRQTLEQLEVIREPKSSSWGTIYGELGSIYVRNANEYRVWDEDSGKPVVCNFKPNEEQIIKDMLRSRVAVTGVITANSQGWPLSIRKVENLDRVNDGELPTIEEMTGSIEDFTGGVSLKEFLEEMDT